MQLVYPCVIRFSGGRPPAEAVPNGAMHDGPPRYTIAGEICDLDPTIPADIAAGGWYWDGGHLTTGSIVLACAKDLEDYWRLAREHIAIRAELARRVRTQVRRRKTPPPAAQPVQAEMELT